MEAKMKRIYKIITPVSLALFFSACGGENDSHFGNSENKRSIVKCDETNQYTQIQTNDKLIEEDTNTTVKIIHNPNNTKQVCVQDGSAYLLRK
jgi:maltose-binding protein MalE